MFIKNDHFSSKSIFNINTLYVITFSLLKGEQYVVVFCLFVFYFKEQVF